jgi:hypothetical protein
MMIEKENGREEGNKSKKNAKMGQYLYLLGFLLCAKEIK